MTTSSDYDKKNRILLGIFLGGLFGFGVLLYNRPIIENQDHLNNVSFPPTPQDLFYIAQFVLEYMEHHFLYTIFAFFYLYILLQAFAIPGPIFLCLISPTLFGPVKAFFICISCSCFGASLCYFMSLTLAKQLVKKKFSVLFHKFNHMVSAHKNNLFWYMLFLRLTPLIPNWFVNLASPLVGIPYVYFLFASMFGMMPMNFILIQTGQTLKQIESIGIQTHHFITLFILGLIALIPTFLTKKYKAQLEGTDEQSQSKTHTE